MTLAPVFALLLVTTFASTGLLSLWAATSPRHWFVRAAVFLVVLSPLLLIPAYEPVVAFAIQGLIVACGVQIYRRWRKGRPKHESSVPADKLANGAGIRFSLSTLLLIMALVAVSTPVVVKLPALNYQAWYSVAAIGVTCGLMTLVAASMFTSEHKFIVWPSGLFLCLVVGFVLFKIDWFVPSIVAEAGWPPIVPPPRPIPYSGSTPQPPTLVWPIALLANLILLATIVSLWYVAYDRRRLVRSIVAVLIASIAAFPLYILWQLLHPLPVPTVQLPAPNGYGELVTAGNIFNGSPILNTTVEPKSTAELAAEVAKYATTFARVRAAIAGPCQLPVWPTKPYAPLNFFSIPDVQAMRGVARAIDREADLAKQQDRFRDAAMISIDNIRFGEASAHGGLLPHYLVGIAIQGIGQASLYPTITHLDAKTCHEAIQLLEQLDQNREPLDEFIHRDRVYQENANGWNGHLILVLYDIVKARQQFYDPTQQASLRSTAVAGLLRMELALRQYQLENGVYPKGLDALVPKYASSILADPYDANQSPLRYSRTSNGYLLYSVGYDGDDDGGRPSTQESGWMDDGDIRLDSFFAPDPNDTTPTTNGDGADADDPADSNQ